MSGERRHRRRLRDYPVFPTILTSGNLACGLTAILCAGSSHGETGLLFQGAVLVFAAMLFDMFDGKVARMTGTDGEFGAELDSIADIVSFGVAPAMLVHRVVLGDHPDTVWGQGERYIWFISVLYPVLTAIRLARYNVEHDSGPTRFFRGLPSPGAAAVLAAWVMLYGWFTDLDGARYDGSFMAQNLGMAFDRFRSGVRLVLMIVSVSAALLMVSTMRFPHLGNILLSGRMGLIRLVLLVLLVGLLIIEPFPVSVVATSGYLLGGLGYGLWHGIGNLRRRRSFDAEDEDEFDNEDEVFDEAR